jgi:potassium efflux system protein
LAASLILVTSTRAQAPNRGADPQPTTVQTDRVAIPGLSRPAGLTEADIVSLRADTAAQLKALESATPTMPSSTAATTPRPGSTPAPTPAAPAGAAADPALHDLLQRRLNFLEEYDKAVNTLKKATKPEPNPEQQVAESKAELHRQHAILERAAARPETLLPPAFRSPAAGGSSSLDGEMKDALEATTNDLKEWKSKLETLRTEVVNWENRQDARRVERDKLFQRVAALKVRGVEREAGVGVPTTRARRLAQERLINWEWEARVEALRLQVIEAQIALETKLKGGRELSIQVCKARIHVLDRTLELMQQRYRAAAEIRERDLQAKAAREADTARRSADPLERFRARREAELAELEVQVVKYEQILATSPSPSLFEQRSLADHAQADLARVKELLDDGRVSRLDAVRLNNEFRRIGPERDRLLHNEMAIVEGRMQYYEDALTKVEIDLLQDSLRDRFEQDLLQERLPPARAAEGAALLAALVQKQRTMLVRRRAALERLTDCTAQTLQEVTRRLGILDEEYGFIRTNLFWVRDQEPIGLGTLSQAIREVQQLAKTLLRLAQETAKPGHRDPPTAEFLVAALLALGLPVGLVRLRRSLRVLIDRDLPPCG